MNIYKYSDMSNWSIPLYFVLIDISNLSSALRKFTQKEIINKLLLKFPNLILESWGSTLIVIFYCWWHYSTKFEIFSIYMNSILMKLFCNNCTLFKLEIIKWFFSDLKLEYQKILVSLIVEFIKIYYHIPKPPNGIISSPMKKIFSWDLNIISISFLFF